MRSTLLALAFFSTGAVAADCPAPKPFQVLAAEKASNYDRSALVASLTKGKSHTDKSIQTKHHVPQILNLWATWCAPCRVELPLLDKLAKQGVATIDLINIDDSEADAEKLLNTLNIQHLETYYADYEFMSQLAIHGLPATVVYAKNQVFLGVGVLKDEAELNHWLACLSTTPQKNKIPTGETHDK